MDLDIEMDVDDVHEVPAPAIPAAYTEDIITGEEQVRIAIISRSLSRSNPLTRCAS